MITFSINGYYPESFAKGIVKAMKGKTFFNFNVSYSNCAGNCTILVESDRDDYTADEAKSMFFHCALAELAKRVLKIV